MQRLGVIGGMRVRMEEGFKRKRGQKIGLEPHIVGYSRHERLYPYKL